MSSADSDKLVARLYRWLRGLFRHEPERSEPERSEPEFDHTNFLITVFLALRRSGVGLGIGELQAVMRLAAEHPDRNDPAKLKLLTRLVWCHTPAEEQLFEEIWTTLLTASQPEASSTTGREATLRDSPAKSQLEPDQPAPERPPTDESDAAPPAHPHQWEPLPFRVPFTPAPLDDRFELGSYWPVSRRQMAYAWRYLRRPVADGPQDLLDIEMTVAQAARQGLFLGPVYRRRERNQAHLLLLIDQNGSMVPFHRFTRDLADTARYESTLEQVEVYYFHNVPAADVYADPHMTAPVSLAGVLARCTTDTSVLLASDAGAARGYRRLERIRATSEFLRTLERHTPLLAWLNPMPATRWAGTSAQVIANLVQGQMFQMDPDGLSQAIDRVRGQPFRPYR
jgi:hypothetical protein